ncbi:c-type cytochrome [Alsobacter sp. R-9]
MILPRLVALVIGASVLSASGVSAQPADIPEKAVQCLACHGEKGVPADKLIPVIFGQHQGYVYLMLRDFKLGIRKNEIMNAMAADMSRDEMMAIAEWFSKQQWPNLNQPRASEADTKRAETAIVAGQCGACHGAQGMGDSTNPRIAGQSHEYLLLTLTEFRSRKRTNNPWMSDILNTLAPEDITALAAFMAGR